MLAAGEGEAVAEGEAPSESDGVGDDETLALVLADRDADGTIHTTPFQVRPLLQG